MHVCKELLGTVKFCPKLQKNYDKNDREKWQKEYIEWVQILKRYLMGFYLIDFLINIFACFDINKK